MSRARKMVRFDGVQTKASLVSLLFRRLTTLSTLRRWRLLQTQFARRLLPVGWWLDGSAALSSLARKRAAMDRAASPSRSKPESLRTRAPLIPPPPIIQDDARYTQDAPHRPPQVDEQTGRSSILGACRPQDVKSILGVKCPMRRRQDSNIISITSSRGILKTYEPAAPATSNLGTSSLKNEDRLNCAIWITSVVIK
ncbi:hypothetical protein B0H16DRAFT_1768933 [Mycena metata]|uniref:Uncharacterized protein n=1 Tax=Mycena metata TaxID=1033252 RepID=A0AAD7JUX8_9AGAR|nr:hypothetical protein B0H16DRAFT_1768933 [Mycena metata]